MVFSKWSQINILFLKLLIYTYLWTKNDFLKWLKKICFTTKNVHIWIIMDFFQNYLIYRALRQNIDIYMDKKIFSKCSIKTSFTPKYWYLYGEKPFFQNYLKNELYSKILIFIWRKPFFQNYLKNELYSKILLFIWTKNDSLKMIQKTRRFRWYVSNYHSF